MEFNPLEIELIGQSAQIKAFNVNKALQIIAAFLTLFQNYMIGVKLVK